MLVLSRKVGEKLVIGDNITIIVNRVAGNRVTIGIEAPPSIRVIRGELQKTVEESSRRLEMDAPTAVARSGNEFERRTDVKEASHFRLAK